MLISAAALLAGPRAAGAAELLLRAGDLQVPPGTIVRGDAIAVGGTATIGGTVEGDAVALGGSVEVTGHIGGSVRAVGGNVILHSGAVVGGQARAIGGTVEQEPGASVGGAQPQPAPLPPLPPLPAPGPRAFPFPSPWVRPFPAPAPGPWSPWPWGLGGSILSLRPLFSLLYLGALVTFVGTAWLVAVLFPGLTARLAGVMERDPLGTFGVGLLGWPIAGMLAFVLVLSVIGLTLALLVPVAVLVALQLGTTAVALLIGQRVRRSDVAHEVVVGAVILAVAFSIPHLGWLLVLAVSTWGLGSVFLAMLERHRSRSIPPTSPPAFPQQS
ncbi:MAG TPA: polymer-forming cytoskeletal protein [bacterium]|nr:polymer-forming cytoskeletal protein [bacterium]